MGGVDGDVIRDITGQLVTEAAGLGGAFVAGSNATGAPSTGTDAKVSFIASRVVPTGPVNAPRRWGALACAYLGQPAS